MVVVKAQLNWTSIFLSSVNVHLIATYHMQYCFLLRLFSLMSLPMTVQPGKL